MNKGHAYMRAWLLYTRKKIWWLGSTYEPINLDVGGTNLQQP